MKIKPGMKVTLFGSEDEIVSKKRVVFVSQKLDLSIFTSSKIIFSRKLLMF